MASRARKSSTKTSLTGWREMMRQSIIRSGTLIAAIALAVFALFYALSVLSYSPADAAFNSAAEGVRHNWMGAMGAYLGDGALFLFGLPAILLLPLVLVFAQRLWKDMPQPNWKRQLAFCIIRMLLIGFGIAYWQSGSDIGLPGGLGGVLSLMLENAAIWGAAQAGESWQGLIRWFLIIASLLGGIALVIRSLELEKPLLRMPDIAMPKLGGSGEKTKKPIGISLPIGLLK